MEFKPIETQEAFDAAIKDRLARQTEKHNAEIAEIKAQFADYETLKTSSAELTVKLEEASKTANENAKKYEGYDSKVAEYEAKIKQYETEEIKHKVVAELGLPYDALQFINGDTEDTIRTSAESLKAFAGTSRVTPLAVAEGTPLNGEKASLKEMLNNLF